MNQATQPAPTTPDLDAITPEEIAAWASPGAAKEEVRRTRRASRPRATKIVATERQRPSTGPADCRVDHSEAELELMQAMKDYKESSNRLFPTWSEVLEVVLDLGYRKRS